MKVAKKTTTGDDNDEDDHNEKVDVNISKTKKNPNNVYDGNDYLTTLNKFSKRRPLEFLPTNKLLFRQNSPSNSCTNCLHPTRFAISTPDQSGTRPLSVQTLIPPITDMTARLM